MAAALGSPLPIVLRLRVTVPEDAPEVYDCSNSHWLGDSGEAGGRVEEWTVAWPPGTTACGQCAPREDHGGDVTLRQLRVDAATAPDDWAPEHYTLWEARRRVAETWPCPIEDHATTFEDQYDESVYCLVSTDARPDASALETRKTVTCELSAWARVAWEDVLALERADGVGIASAGHASR